jgi:hypothetical protein
MGQDRRSTQQEEKGTHAKDRKEEVTAMDCTLSACLVMFNGMISLAILYFACRNGENHGF